MTTVAEHIPPGVKRHPGRPANRRLAIRAGKTNATYRQIIKMRRLQTRVPHAGQVIRPELIRHDK